jgi:di/tricarboxylate transporter
MAGLMGVTAFLSMWINNSAATSIMIPAAVAIVDELRSHREEAQRVVAFRNHATMRKSKDTILSDCAAGQNGVVIYTTE